MFGLKIDGAKVSWGARAIYQGSKDDFSIDLLWDRQQMDGGDEKSRKKLCDWVNKVGLKKLKKLLKSEYICPEDEAVVEIEDAGADNSASPNRSYGYLYIGAAILEKQEV